MIVAPVLAEPDALVGTRVRMRADVLRRAVDQLRRDAKIWEDAPPASTRDGRRWAEIALNSINQDIGAIEREIAALERR